MGISASLFLAVILVAAEPGWEREVKNNIATKRKSLHPFGTIPQHLASLRIPTAACGSVPTLGELLCEFFVLVNLGNPGAEHC